MAKASADFAKDVTAQMFQALRTPMIQGERHVTTRRGNKVVEDTHNYSIPAWFLVGAAVAVPIGMWFLGIGVKPVQGTNDKGEPRTTGLQLSERPRMVLPFGGSTSFSLL